MTETITETKPGTTLFLSSKPELWLIRQPSHYRYNSVGVQIGVTQAVRYKFTDHQLRVKPGQDMLPDGEYGEDGVQAKQDAISWLRAHPGLNGSEVDAFTEHGAEPDRVEPPTKALAAITNAAIYGDVIALQEILDSEVAGPNREVVILQAQDAIEQATEAQRVLDEADAAAAAENG